MSDNYKNKSVDMFANSQFKLNRRQLLKAGVLSTVVLSSAIAVNQLINSDNHLDADSHSSQLSGYQFLNGKDVAFFSAVVPAILGLTTVGIKTVGLESVGANWYAEQRSIFLKQLDEKLFYLSPALQLEMRELLSLVSSPFSQWLITGVRGDWKNTSEEVVEQFLKRWKTSRLSLLRKAHFALTQLCIMTWYSLPLRWSEIGYLGPPLKESLITPPNSF